MWLFLCLVVFTRTKKAHNDYVTSFRMSTHYKWSFCANARIFPHRITLSLCLHKYAAVRCVPFHLVSCVFVRFYDIHSHSLLVAYTFASFFVLLFETVCGGSFSAIQCVPTPFCHTHLRLSINWIYALNTVQWTFLLDSPLSHGIFNAWNMHTYGLKTWMHFDIGQQLMLLCTLLWWVVFFSFFLSQIDTLRTHLDTIRQKCSAKIAVGEWQLSNGASQPLATVFLQLCHARTCQSLNHANRLSACWPA